MEVNPGALSPLCQGGDKAAGASPEINLTGLAKARRDRLTVAGCDYRR